MLSDLQLVTRVISANDQVAFQALVERYQSPVRGFLRRLTAGDHGTADDLAQETFLLAWRKLSSWNASGSLTGWLHSIAYRQFLQFTRKHRHQDVVSEPPDEGFDPRAAMDAEILLPVLMRQVSVEERACLSLAHAQGMSHAEIAAITGLALGSVKSHIFRGRQKLQQWMQAHDHSLQATGPNPASETQHAS